MKYLEFAKTKYQAPPAGFIFAGEDIYFLSEGVKKARAIVNVENPELNIDIANDSASFFNSLESMPFLSEYRLVIFAYADFSDKTFAKQLKEYIKNPNPTSVFILSTDKVVKTAFGVETIDCSKESEFVLSKWVGGTLRNAGKTISQENALDIVRRCRCDMAKISKETQKLIFYCESEVSQSDIEDCCIREVEKVIFKLTDAIADKNGKTARTLMLEMQSDMTIFQVQGLLFKMFQRMFFIRTSGKTNGEIAEILGVKEYAIKLLAQKASKFSKLKLKEAVEYLEMIDSQIKSGKINQNGVIEDMILYLMK